MISPKLQKWITASINTFFKVGWNTAALMNPSLLNVKPYFQGQTPDLVNDAEWFEVRVDGPQYTEITKNQFRIHFIVNIMISIKMVDNAYRIHELAGAIQSLFTTMPIFNYDTVPPTIISCFAPAAPIDTIFWGQMQVGTNPVRVLNLSVEGDYNGVLTGI